MDARTLTDSARITVLATTETELLSEYMDWLRQGNLSESDIWYAEVFDAKTERVLYRYIACDDGSIEIRDTDEERPMFKRSVFAKLKDKIRGREKIQ